VDQHSGKITATPLFFSLENSINFPYSRTHSLNPLHRIYSAPNTKKREMSQSRLGENSNSFNNNSFGNNNHTFNNNTNSLNTIINNITSVNHASNVNNYGIVDERDKILAWLSPLDPRIRHQDIREHRVKDVGDWLLRLEEYQNWHDGIHSGERNNSTLFCYGDPGVGKTYIR